MQQTNQQAAAAAEHGTIETVPAGRRYTKGGYQIDGSVVQFWGTKAKAAAAAKSIGWPVKSVVPVWTRFQMGYALYETFGGLVTKRGFADVASRFASTEVSR